MPLTLKHGISYPLGTVAPNVPIVMQTQAESVDAALTAVSTKIRHVEYTSAIFATTAGSGRDTGVLTSAAGYVFNNTFVQPSVAGKVKFLEAGVYSIDFVALPVSSPGTVSLQIQGQSQIRIAQAVGGNYGGWEISASASNVYIPANETVSFNVVCTNALNFGARIRITKLHG